MKPRITVITIGASGTEFTIGHNDSSKAEVDAVMNQAKRAGAAIVKPTRETFWACTSRVTVHIIRK